MIQHYNNLSKEPKTVVYVRLDEYDTGSFLIKDKNTVISSVGQKMQARDFPVKIPGSNKKPGQVWTIIPTYPTFTVVLLKRRKFWPNDQIGEIELPIADFAENKVVTKEYNLKAFQSRDKPAKVRLSVHVDNDGALPFRPGTAPANNSLGT